MYQLNYIKTSLVDICQGTRVHICQGTRYKSTIFHFFVLFDQTPGNYIDPSLAIY
jgi:hypothetical protein